MERNFVNFIEITDKKWRKKVWGKKNILTIGKITPCFFITNRTSTLKIHMNKIVV